MGGKTVGVIGEIGKILGGSGDMLPWKSLKIWDSYNAFPAFWSKN